MRDFRSLAVWQKGHHLTLAIYHETAGFPREEIYGLTSQMRRAAMSIPGNIAEGCGKASDAELARYMQISMGSASELEYYVLLACDLKYIQSAIYERLLNDVVEIKKMLAAFIKRLRT